MQKASVMKGSGLKPLSSEDKSNEVVHVFGQNLEERVVTKDNEDQLPSISFDIVSNNQIPRDREDKEEDDIQSIRKRKFDAITGEEDEVTVFQGDFKLFSWDLASSNWVEKGRGQLKLNDSMDQDKKRSRLIMRVGGTLRIILNVAIKRSYFRVLANSKTNIRFTDSQTVWAASGSNANQLKELLDERLRLSEEQEEAESRLKKASIEKEDSEARLKEVSTGKEESKVRVTETEPKPQVEEATAKGEESESKVKEATTKDGDLTAKVEDTTADDGKSDAKVEETTAKDDEQEAGVASGENEESGSRVKGDSVEKEESEAKETKAFDEEESATRKKAKTDHSSSTE